MITEPTNAMHPRTLIPVLITVLSLVFPQDPEHKAVLCPRAQTVARLPAGRVTPAQEQHKFDISYYRLELDIDPAAGNLSARTDIHIMILDSSLNVIELDLTNPLQVDSVYLQGAAVTWTHNANLLQIPLEESYPPGHWLKVTVGYSGTPAATGFGSFNFDTYDGKDHIWTLSEPYGARDWWPCKDDPRDKADSVDLVVTVPADQIVASNGRLDSVITNQNGTRSFYWHESYPIATYLVSLAIYPYTVWHEHYTTLSGDTMPIDFYVFPDQLDIVQPTYRLTNDMLTVFAGLFGEYPFVREKYGHAQFGWRGGGMEHQTLTSLAGHSSGLIAHELAHQWWGDMVTCASFHHIWLNEGLATYSEALWIENQHGIQAYREKMQARAYYGPGTVFVEEPQSVADIFNYDLTYAKASWILHMLRHILGDSTFFKALRTYGSEPGIAYGTATTEQFQQICETVSGLDLDDFFRQWVYGEYYPVYALAWRGEQDSVEVTIRQVQTGINPFHMPIDLRLVCRDTIFTVVVDNKTWTETFTIHLPADHLLEEVVLDPENWILRQVQIDDFDPNDQLPDKYRLHPAYPNPFNTGTVIPFDLPVKTTAKLVIFDLGGRVIWEYRESFEAGGHHTTWDGRDRFGGRVHSGIYIVRMSTPSGFASRKIVLLK